MCVPSASDLPPSMSYLADAQLSTRHLCTERGISPTNVRIQQYPAMYVLMRYACIFRVSQSQSADIRASASSPLSAEEWSEVLEVGPCTDGAMCVTASSWASVCALLSVVVFQLLYAQHYPVSEFGIARKLEHWLGRLTSRLRSRSRSRHGCTLQVHHVPPRL